MTNNLYKFSNARIYKIPNFRGLCDTLIRAKYDLYGEVPDGELLWDAKNDYDYDYDVMYAGAISMLAHTSSKISRMKTHILSSIIDARSNVLDYTSELKIARRTHHTM